MSSSARENLPGRTRARRTSALQGRVGVLPPGRLTRGSARRWTAKARWHCESTATWGFRWVKGDPTLDSPPCRSTHGAKPPLGVYRHGGGLCGQRCRPRPKRCPNCRPRRPKVKRAERFSRFRSVDSNSTLDLRQDRSPPTPTTQSCNGNCRHGGRRCERTREFCRPRPKPCPPFCKPPNLPRRKILGTSQIQYSSIESAYPAGPVTDR